MRGLPSTNFVFPGQKDFYRGKVRDVYYLENDLLVVVASDRISAFDHILPRPIPDKGAVLNGIASYSLQSSNHIVPNWLIETPDPNVSIGRYFEPIRIEMVVRAYLAGHAWREYRLGKRTLCGATMPEGMNESDRFPGPIITPATKAEEGHDEDISPSDILKRGIVSLEEWEELAAVSLELFEFGSEEAKKRGLILVDTKYEFARNADGGIVLIDEIHTPDSSRYYYAEGYQERQEKGEKQKHLSKEFVREWLMSEGFQGLEGQQMPEMSDEVVEMIRQRYLELYRKLRGQELPFHEGNSIVKRIESNTFAALSRLQ